MQPIHRYIKIGTYSPDPQVQDGSEAKKYEAGNAAEFDKIMRDILPDGTASVPVQIHLADGIYSTYGMLYSDGTKGWNVRSNWRITGEGEAATVIKLQSWPGQPHVEPGNAGSKWSVIGCPINPESARVSNVSIENLTVDGNWLNLPNDGKLPPGYPNSAEVALHCVACITKGPITHRNLTITGFYGHAATNTECFALCAHSIKPMDPETLDSTWLAVFDHCTVHHGHGDYCVGIASFNGGPTIIDSCHIYSLGEVRSSSAIQVIGKDIQVTNNIVRDCFFPFYVDSGNIINLLIERNQFFSNGPAVILSNLISQSVYINLRQGDVNRSFDGVYLDVPIRPVASTNPRYRVRLYFHCITVPESTFVPPPPEDGILVPCPYHAGATKEQLEGTANSGPIYEGLAAFFALAGAPVRFVSYTRSYEAAALSFEVVNVIVDITTSGTGTQSLTRSGAFLGTFSADTGSNFLTITGTPPENGNVVTVSTSAGGVLPIPLVAGKAYVVREASGLTFKLEEAVNLGAWIRHSAGAPSVSDTSKVYIQSSWSWTNWKIRNNYLELPFINPNNPPSWGVPDNQYMIALNGNGSADGDYRIADNVCRFSGAYKDIRTLGLVMDGIERVAVLNNVFDQLDGEYGEVQIFKAGSVLPNLIPIDVLYRFGNKDLNEQPHPWLPDDLHSWANLGPGESYVHGNASTPKPGLGTTPFTGSHLSNEADAALDGQQVSPATRWSGRGWTVDGAGASQPVEFRAYVLPVQGLVNSTGQWVLESSINGGAFTNPLTYTADGALTAPSVVAQDFRGPIGAATPNTGKFTVLEVTGQASLSPTGQSVYLAPSGGFVLITPSNGGVVISPTGTGRTTIHSATPGTMDNIAIGDATPSSGKFTSVNATGSMVCLGVITGSFFVGSGATLTQLGAANLTGHIGIARMANALMAPGPIGGATPDAGTFTTLVAASVTATGDVTAPSFAGSGAGLTGLTKSQVGLSNVDNTSDATKNSAAATLTNKTISGVNNPLSNIDGGSMVGNIAIGRIATALAAPGAIGGGTPGSGAFTTLSASQAVTLSPGTGSVTINPSGTVTIGGTGQTVITSNTTGTINKMNIGATTAGTGRSRRCRPAAPSRFRLPIPP